MMTVTKRELISSRLKLGALLLVFVAPVLASYLAYYMIAPAGPTSTTNHGHLVDPAQPMFVYPSGDTPDTDATAGAPTPRPFLVAADLRSPDGEPVAPALFRERWTLLYIARGECGESCRTRLYDTRQVRTATGRERLRVRRILLLIDPVDLDSLMPFFKREHPGLNVLVGHLPAAAGLLHFFSPPGKADTGATGRAGRVYLIDPLGNWFMYYRRDEPASGMLDDLQKVMRASSIG